MIGIEEIGVYFPEGGVSNYDRKEQFGIDDIFIKEKIGVESLKIKSDDEETSDLCVKAFENILEKKEIDKSKVDCLVVVTQNPDYNLPHTSAIVHGKLDIHENCACFDISLGCSGYVYALSVIQSFMKENNFKSGLLFTADPYSKIIQPDDKNTSLLFGDAATVTLIDHNPVFVSNKFNFGTIGKDYENLICKQGKLAMNGRAIFNFAARYVPKDIEKLLMKNTKSADDIDLFLFHQGSKHIVETLKRRINIPEGKIPFGVVKYGNTVSSSIPILLSNYVKNKEIGNIVISGFGVGLSWSSTILSRVNK